MNYREALATIHSLDRFGSRPGLDRVQMLFDRIPQTLGQRFVHIAGTNGKGSVSNMIAAVLRQAGYKVGLFISPYIVDFRERIQIDAEMVSEEELAGAVTFLAPILDELRDSGVIITEFEFLTAVGFWIFLQNNCDVVVCEVGMGGLLDSTNLIPSPLCAVITRIALDHTAILGETIGEIAVQKCGIIKESCPVAASSQEDEAMEVIVRTADEKHAALYRGEDIGLGEVQCGLGGTEFVYRGQRMRLSLVGEHQAENLRCALAAIEALNERHGLGITTEQIKAGLAKVKHPARFEVLGENPVVVLDGAHNPNGLAAFADTVKACAPKGEKTLVIGMLADKDSAGLGYLKGLFKRAIVTNIDNPRALAAQKLAERLGGIVEQIEVVEKPGEAFAKAMEYRDDIYICGSLYLASQIRPYILGKKNL